MVRSHTGIMKDYQVIDLNRTIIILGRCKSWTRLTWIASLGWINLDQVGLQPNATDFISYILIIR